MILHSKEIIDGYIIEKYTGGDNIVEILPDRTEISAIIKYADPDANPVIPPSTDPTPEEVQAQILLNTEFLVIMSELSNM